jgi:mono/diheme cytochrome c family protein
VNRHLQLASFLIAISPLIAVHPAIAQDGPPPMPVYQDIGQPPPGDRHAPGRDGEALFSSHCGQCHLPWGMGTNMLTAQRAAAGLPPESGLLANRDDLTADYVRTVVRHGTPAMPPLTRVQVTGSELDAIADWLAEDPEP